MQRQSGVTLIELLIVVAIGGILASIALPAYRDYVIRGKLTDSQASLSATRTRLEQFYQDNRSYPAACGGTATGLPTFTMPTSQYFTYACAAGTTAGQNYTLTATGVSTQGTGGFVGSRAERKVQRAYLVENRHTTPIAVQVLEAAPVSVDEQVRVTAQFAPQPAELAWNKQPGVALWSLDLAAGQSARVAAEYLISYPKDARLQER